MLVITECKTVFRLFDFSTHRLFDFSVFSRCVVSGFMPIPAGSPLQSDVLHADPADDTPRTWTAVQTVQQLKGHNNANKDSSRSTTERAQQRPNTDSSRVTTEGAQLRRRARLFDFPPSDFSTLRLFDFSTFVGAPSR